MISKTIRIASLSAVMAAFSLAGAQAQERAPTAEETARISSVLGEQGYRDWTGIEMDDGQWEVDNAVGKDGRKFDITLDPSFKIVDVEVED